MYLDPWGKFRLMTADSCQCAKSELKNKQGRWGPGKRINVAKKIGTCHLSVARLTASIIYDISDAFGGLLGRNNRMRFREQFIILSDEIIVVAGQDIGGAFGPDKPRLDFAQICILMSSHLLQ